MFFFFFDDKSDNSNLPDIPDFKNIRKVWHESEEQWYFSVVDVVGVLTDQPTLDRSRKYWSVLKTRLKKEGNELTTICSQLKMSSADGKMRMTDAADTEGLLRIVQSIPSPKAEPFKQWLAQVGADRINDIEAARLLAEETDRRLAARDDVKKHNKSLAEAALNSGVKTDLDFAKFQNSGYIGLYDGETAADIKRRKGIKGSKEILDHMGSEELAANLFRITQTEAKLRRDSIKNKEEANKTHFSVGRTVRKTIEELGGTMPEKLSTPEKSIREIKKFSKEIEIED